MSILWPRQINPQPGPFTRLGRVVHWIGLLALLVCCAIAANFAYGDAHPEPTLIVISLVVGLLFYFPARAIRWIVAAE